MAAHCLQKISNNRVFLFIFLVLSCTAIQATEASSENQRIHQQALDIVKALTDEEGKLVRVTVDAGVLTVTGQTATDPEVLKKALGNIEGAVAVVVETERILPSVESLKPAVTRIEQFGLSLLNYLPLTGIALCVVVVFWLLARAVSLLEPLLQRSFPSTSARDVIMQGLRVIIMLLGFVLALEILNATALVGGILGAAGVAGIAIGFAFRDLIENYLASVMLGIRQPFRPGDFVRISQDEGIVARLTSRSTILMTLDGNRLRIPNGDVFKSTILNYSTTPERRFEFNLGISYQIDPEEAIQLGVQTLKTLKGVEEDPRPFGRVVELGDSTIKLIFFAWVNQSRCDFGLIRSKALTSVKAVFDDHGIEMPEPTFNLRMLNPSSEQPAEPATIKKSASKVINTHHPDEDNRDSGMDFARKEAAKEAAAGENSLELKAPELLD